MRSIGKRTWLVAAAATTVLGIAQAPALAAPSVTTPTISISAKSALKPVTGDVFVVFRGGSLSHAQIKGSVTGAASGEVLQLFAQQFPYKKAAVKLDSPVTLTGASTPYWSAASDPRHALPGRAVFTGRRGETMLVAKSAFQKVFVAARGHWSKARSCNRRGQRPVCHQRFHLTVTVPPSTLRTERPKPWFLYFGLKLKRTGEPGAAQDAEARRRPRPRSQRQEAEFPAVRGDDDLFLQGRQ